MNFNPVISIIIGILTCVFFSLALTYENLIYFTSYVGTIDSITKILFSIFFKSNKKNVHKSIFAILDVDEIFNGCT